MIGAETSTRMSPPNPRGRRQTAMRWTGYFAIAVAFAIACAFLSHWQFSRNAERTAELALVEANYDAPPVPIEEELTRADTFEPESEWHPVMMTGQYLNDQQLVVRNRPHGGTAAYEVLVPFQLDSGRVFLIDRGWVQPGDNAQPEFVPEAPDGPVTVIARIRPGEVLPSSGRSAPEGQVPTINLALVDEILPADIDTSAYLLMASEDPAARETPNAIASPSADPGPYLSYAVQWILFAIMGFVFIWYIIRSERRHRKEDEEDAADVGDGATPRRRLFEKSRDQDMQDEDALLDDARLDDARLDDARRS